MGICGWISAQLLYFDEPLSSGRYRVVCETKLEGEVKTSTPPVEVEVKPERSRLGSASTLEVQDTDLAGQPVGARSAR